MTLQQLAKWSATVQGQLDGTKHMVVKLPNGEYAEVQSVSVADRRLVINTGQILVVSRIIKP